MTSDDDAFIRAIVDSPGNDLPRLVYADWLDDRDDPRGPFLRAEVEWAQPWKDGQRPGDASELRAMATGLDPLWVARVSRPPEGVCCDHIAFADSGHPISSNELAECEQRLQVRFGTELTALLLNHNGGCPTPAYFVHPTKRDPYSAHWFLPATAITFTPPQKDQPYGGSIESYMPVLNNAGLNVDPTTVDWSKWERVFLPFAFGGNLGCVAIGLKARRSGKIYYINRPAIGSASTPALVCDSVADFISWIAKPSWA